MSTYYITIYIRFRDSWTIIFMQENLHIDKYILC